MKKLYFLTGLLLSLHLVSAQGDMAMNVMSGNPLPHYIKADNSLLGILDQIEKKFAVFFNFDTKLLSQMEINEEITISDNLNETLDRILKPLGLAYKSLGNGYFVIYADREVDEKPKEKPIPGLPADDSEGKDVGINERTEHLVPLITHRNRPSALLQFGQNITGRVTDSQGEPLIGVNIQVKGTNQGTSTDFEGEFVFDDIDENAVLVVSYIGYQTQEVPVAGKSVLNITLISDSQLLDEVVVVGYGTKAKGQLTGAVSNVKGESLEQIRTADLTKSLQGIVPGLIINDRGGVPGGEDVELLVRGSHTLGNNSPLIVIDGVPRSGFGQLSANDIEDISVLKDASAAIYGARAANGVIVVRTKRGKVGKMQLQLNSSYGINALTRKPEMMDSWEWATYQNEVEVGYGRTPRFTDEDIEKFRSGENPITHPNTDFYDLTFRKFSPITQHSLSASGGSENVQYYISGDFLRQESQYSSGDGHYNQFQIRSNVDASLNKYLDIGMDINLRLEENRMPSESIANIIHRVYFNFPSEPAFYPNGLPYFTREGGGNPVVLNSYDVGWNQDRDKIIQTKLSFDFNMDWLVHGLGLIGYAAFDYDIRNNELFRKPTNLFKYNINTDSYDPVTGTVPSSGNTSLTKRNDINRSELYHIRLRYDQNFGNHNLSAFVAYEQNETVYDYISAYRQNLFSKNKVELFAGEEDGRRVDGSGSIGGRVNYFGNASYDYKRKYMIDFTLRRDGSFNFPEDHRFGLFSAVSAGWNISQESFLNGFDSFLDDLKLRVSYGEMGNDRIPAYQYLTKYSTGSYLILGESPTYYAGMDIASIPNPNITWEVAKTFNTGFDAVFWKGSLVMNFDYFFEKREGILIQRNESVPNYTALELPDENLGKVNNAGVEVVLGHTKNVGEFKYNVGGNFTFNRSKIIYMDEPKGIPEYRKQEGHPLNSIVAYVTDGFFNDQNELDNYPHLSGALPGGLKYVDINEDGVIDDADQVRHYTSSIPEIQFGLNMGAALNNFDIIILFQGQANATAPLMFNDSGTKPKYLFTDRWTEENRDAIHPRPFSGFDTYQKLSTYHFNNASFVRLKNLEFGYNFNLAKWLPENTLEKFRIYVRGRNLFTLSHIKYFDPEVPYQADYSRGPRAKYYPQLTTYTFGLNLIF